MADRLVAIRRLLTHERHDRRVAAAIVMNELGVSDNRSINALLRAYDDDEQAVRRAVVEALGATGAPKAITKLIEALSDSDPVVQQHAEMALLKMGDAAIPELEQALQGPAARRRRAAAVLGQMQTSAGVDSLIDSIDGNDAAVLDRTRQALRSRVQELSQAELRSLRKRLESRLNEARHNRENNLAAATLLLMGDLPDETVVTRIAQELGPDVPAPVRRAALTAMMNALPLSRARRREVGIEKLLDCLGEGDNDSVIRPALRALRDIDIPSRFTDKLQPLVESAVTEVRAFALSALGSSGNADSIDILVNQLAIGPAPVRVAAREALLANSDAATPLARALLELTDTSRLNELGDVLAHHRDALPRDEADTLCVTTIDRVLDGDEDTADLVETVSRALPDLFVKQALQRVQMLRAAGDLSTAHELLAHIDGCTGFGDDERYLLALLAILKNAESGRPPRVGDRVCAPLSELLRRDYPLEAKLREEKRLTSRDLFHLGFAFSESNDENERDFGHELLEEVVEREPDGKFGARAKNRLRIAGL